MAVIDQILDKNGTHLLRLSKLYPLPSFVKDAEALNGADPASIALSTFGDRTKRMFPCHTKASTYLSYLYFLDNENEMHTKQARIIRGNLDRMAGFWNLTSPNGAVTQLKEAHAKNNEEAFQKLSNEDFAIAVDYDGHIVRKLPMPNAVSVEKAAEVLYRDRSKYPYSWRKQAARKIIKKAEELQVELEADTEEYLQKAAGFGTTSAQTLSDSLHERAHVLRGYPRFRSASDRLSKYAEEIRTMKTNTELLDKTAEFIDMIDRQTGLYKKYSYREDNLPTPEEVVYTMTEKKASSVLNKFVQLTTGHMFDREDLEKAGVDVFTAALGDDIEDLMFDPESKKLDIEKAAEMLPTLPRDDAEFLVNALSNAGIKPVHKKEALEKEAATGDSYSLAMDLSSWKDYVSQHASHFGNPNARIITRADELEQMQSRAPVL